jgi:endonuclease V-like protein UPF0215 family
MKDNPITIGFDDAKFELKSHSRNTQLIGVVCQGTRMVNVVKQEILIDGDDATNALIELVRLNQNHIQYILMDTITFGGFNIVDLDEIYNITGKPIIAITEREVDLDLVKKTIISKFPNNFEVKLQNIIKAGNLFETKIKTAGGISKVFFHSKGINRGDVEALLGKVCIDSKLPESVRLAHIIGKMF